MFAGKAVIGVAGGIGSGKSFVAGLFGELGCQVISSDDLVTAAYQDDGVRQAIRENWGEGYFLSDGRVDRKKLADKVFSNPRSKDWLERLLHPWVNRRRQEQMERTADDPEVVAFVWDTPLLFETGLHEQCDRVVFVEAPEDVRLDRVARTRGWDREELTRRENLQWPLDRKRDLSDYVIGNAADAASTRRQVAEVLSRIRTEVSPDAPE